MALDYTPTTIQSGFASVDALNEEFQKLKTALQDGLSRSGTSPNTLSTDIDMNSNRILNLPEPSSDFEAARWRDVVEGLTGPEGPEGPEGPQGPAGPGFPEGGDTGQILAKASGADYDTQWIAPPEDDRYVGFLYISGNTTPTNIAEQNTYYPVVATSNELPDLNNGFTQSNGRLTCNVEGDPKWYKIHTSVCFSLDVSNVQIRTRLGVNGTSLAETCGQVTLTGTPTSGRRESVSTHAFALLGEGDYVEIFVGNFQTTDNITVINAQLSAEELSKATYGIVTGNGNGAGAAQLSNPFLFTLKNFFDEFGIQPGEMQINGPSLDDQFTKVIIPNTAFDVADNPSFTGVRIRELLDKYGNSPAIVATSVEDPTAFFTFVATSSTNRSGGKEFTGTNFWGNGFRSNLQGTLFYLTIAG